MIPRIFAVVLLAFSALVMAGMAIATLIAFCRWLPMFAKRPKRILLGFVEDNWKGAAFLLACFIGVPFVWLPLCRMIDDGNARIAVGLGVPFVLFLMLVRGRTLHRRTIEEPPAVLAEDSAVATRAPQRNPAHVERPYGR